MLGDVQEPTAPFGLLDVQGDGARTNEVRQVLDGGLAARLRQQSRRHGVSAAALFHLAWALVLARTSGRDDVGVGTVLRSEEHTSEIPSPCNIVCRLLLEKKKRTPH